MKRTSAFGSGPPFLRHEIAFQKELAVEDTTDFSSYHMDRNIGMEFSYALSKKGVASH